MLSSSEKKCLALTLAFLAAGTGFRWWRARGAFIGPAPLAALADAGPSQRGDAGPPQNGEAAPNGDSGVSGGAPPGDKTSFPGDSAPASTGKAPSDPAPRLAFASTALSFATRASGATAHNGSSPRAEKRKAPAHPVPINRASLGELTAVPGVGEKTAEAILAYRKAHGDFRALDDLLNVKGIGEKKLEKMGAYLIISQSTMRR